MTRRTIAGCEYIQSMNGASPAEFGRTAVSSDSCVWYERTSGATREGGLMAGFRQGCTTR